MFESLFPLEVSVHIHLSLCSDMKGKTGSGTEGCGIELDPAFGTSVNVEAYQKLQ